MPPVDSVEVFLKALRKSVKRGYTYEKVKARYWYDDEWIKIQSIWHPFQIPTSASPIWRMSPIQVIFYEFFADPERGHLPYSCTKWCARRIGMTKSVWKTVEKACWQLPGRDVELRKQILEICGL